MATKKLSKKLKKKFGTVEKYEHELSFQRSPRQRKRRNRRLNLHRANQTADKLIYLLRNSSPESKQEMMKLKKYLELALK